METTFENKCRILSDLWTDLRDDEEFEEYVKYNDLGLPLAYMIDRTIIEETPITKAFVEEAFTLLLDLLDIDDEGFEELDDLFR
jgi:hypothetical protein